MYMICNSIIGELTGISIGSYIRVCGMFHMHTTQPNNFTCERFTAKNSQIDTPNIVSPITHSGVLEYFIHLCHRNTKMFSLA